jgi:hypothetical protein
MIDQSLFFKARDVTCKKVSTEWDSKNESERQRKIILVQKFAQLMLLWAKNQVRNLSISCLARPDSSSASPGVHGILDKSS